MHVLHTFSNNSSVPYLSWFAERAHREGAPRFTFILMHPERPRMIDEMKAYGFKCIWIKFSDQHRKRGLLKALFLMWWHMARLRPDVVHSHLMDDSMAGMLAARLAGVKARVVTKQVTGFHWMHAPRWVWVDRFTNRMATDLLAVSGECRQFLLEKEKAPSSKITVVHHGVQVADITAQDPSVSEALRRRFGAIDRFPVIGTVARLIEWKGHRHIVDAAREVVRNHPKALFLFCGQGDQEQAILRQVKEAGLEDHVKLTGWVDRAEIPSFYGMLDIYLHAAALEPFGFVYAEALLNGIPVVSTQTGAAKDAIEDGSNGILVDERNGRSLAEGIERMLRSDRRAIGEAGRKTALSLFPFERMWDGTMNLYRKALARH
ncbi:MAG: glycosyltransferase family 4 protein [Flavobacteriales bacterium]|nr:glycosyltransferase family 4 protein [Flavobacteriales bacterium]